MKENIVKKIHDICGSLNVISGFLRSLDKTTLNPDRLELYGACKLSLDKIERSLDEIRSIAQGPDRQ